MPEKTTTTTTEDQAAQNAHNKTFTKKTNDGFVCGIDSAYRVATNARVIYFKKTMLAISHLDQSVVHRGSENLLRFGYSVIGLISNFFHQLLFAFYFAILTMQIHWKVWVVHNHKFYCPFNQRILYICTHHDDRT